MSDAHFGTNPPAKRSGEGGQEYEGICDAFDSAWRRGERPSIRRVLLSLKRSVPKRLFQHLLEIEVEYRNHAGEVVKASEYHQQFPKCGAIIDKVLADESLQPAASSLVATRELPTEGLEGTVLDRYKLRQQLGEGGFGTVYLAEQTEPVRRRVALKIVKLGMDTKQVIARFSAERQALALMDHPNIAKVLDAGATHTGRPYFVMELVKGIPITEYCDQHSTSLNDRLALFMDVCTAVQHAHQKGIIHRDIKPSNVLVAHVENQPMPKVIDFGIAKAMDQRLTEQTVFTELGQFIGTPAYMSPEQTESKVLDIDTRSDIYSLGVLFYELLTGTTPFDVKKMASDGATFEEIKRVICEQEPIKPSTRLSTLGRDSTTVSKRCGLEPSRLIRLLSGDLDWIVMKALEKDRGRRYETASALADDIRRFLSNEPVQARPPSFVYRWSKFLRRRKRTVVVVGAISAALLLGGFSALWGYFEAQQQRAAATAMADRNRKVVEAFVDSFRDVNPDKAGVTSKMTALEVLERARKRIDQDETIQGSPLTKALLLDAIGSSLTGLGEYEQAISALESSRRLVADRVPADSAGSVRAALLLANAYFHTGDLNTARKLTDPLTLEQSENPALEEQRISSLTLLASIEQASGNLTQAAKLFEEVIQRRTSMHGSDHPELLIAKAHTAECYRTMGRLTDAIDILEEVYPQLLERYPSDHPQLNFSQHTLASCYGELGRFKEAVPLFQECMQYLRHKYGNEHDQAHASINNYAQCLVGLGRYEEAIPLLSGSRDLLTKRLGPDHLKVLSVQNNLGHAYLKLERLDEGVAILEDNLERCTRVLGESHHLTLYTTNNLAGAYFLLDQIQKALPLNEKVAEQLAAQIDANSQPAVLSQKNLAICYMSVGRLDEAMPRLEHAARALPALLGPAHAESLQVMEDYGSALLMQRNFAQAAIVFADLLQVLEEHPDSNLDAGRPIRARIFLAEALLDSQQMDRVTQLLTETVTNANVGRTQQLQLRNLQCVMQAMQQHNPQAEGQMVSSFEELRDSLPATPLRLTWVVQNAAQRLVKYYVATGQLEKSAKWSREADVIDKAVKQRRAGGGDESATNDPPGQTASA